MLDRKFVICRANTSSRLSSLPRSASLPLPTNVLPRVHEIFAKNARNVRVGKHIFVCRCVRRPFKPIESPLRTRPRSEKSIFYLHSATKNRQNRPAHIRALFQALDPTTVMQLANTAVHKTSVHGGTDKSRAPLFAQRRTSPGPATQQWARHSCATRQHLLCW